jgi:hypothetical protein
MVPSRIVVALLLAFAIVSTLPGSTTVADEDCIAIEENGRVYVYPENCVPPEQQNGSPGSGGG